MPNNHNLLDNAILIEPEKTNFEKVLEISKMILERSKQVIDRVSPLITFKDIPFLYENSICLVSGGKGSFKSRTIESIIASVFSLQTNPTGFKALLQGITTLLIDTERNTNESLPLSIQRIKTQAGYDYRADIPDFYPYSLVKIERAERLNILKSIIKLHREKAKDKIIVVLDVASDLIKNFNDVAESLSFLDYLNMLIDEFDISIILVIHENPGSVNNKVRGHLGTESTNKASTVISLENKMGIVKLKYLHIRENKNPGTFNLKYDDELHCLVPISEAEAEMNSNDKIEKIKQILPSILTNAVRNRKELEKEVVQSTGISDRSVSEYLGIIIKSKETLPYKLNEERSGRNKLYTIKQQMTLNN